MKTPLRVGLLAAVVGAMSCQTYDFEPVKPLAVAQTTQTKTVTAQALRPNVMLLLDKSGSMNGPIVETGGCSSCSMCGQPVGCATRITTLQSTMNGYLPANGSIARFGLTIFPTTIGTDQCGAAQGGDVLVHLPAVSTSDDTTAFQMQASTVNTQVQTITANGGTPTNGSLEFLGGLPELNDSTRENFVLLLTDGVPNCNINNVNTCVNAAACECTIQGCATTQGPSDNNFCTRGCLDQDGTVQAIKDLRAKNIRTIVIGFGSDFATPTALATLNAMATAGGVGRTCPMGTDAECGSTGTNPNPCSAGVCQNSFYAASDGTDLAAALNQISQVISGDSICTYMLQAQPSSQDLVSVLINGVAKQSGPDTWILMDGKIILQGATCTEVTNSTVANPVTVEIRIVQSL